MLFRSLLWSLPLSCALLPGLSQAHLYLAADAGTGHFHASCPSGHSCDSSGTGYDAALGYELGHGISVEGGYASFGDDTVRNDKQRQQIRAGGPTLGIASALPINPDWGLDFRLGMMDVTSRRTITGTSPGSDEKSKKEGYYGLGADYAVTGRLHVTLGLLGSRAVWHGGSAKVHNLGLGLRGDF
ncbi:outer membrane beta-barrel protein [Ideonella oryzae]|uniref:Outer membrane beta-barrel protein n=1 Tax=Ideonella oryzae TaxID=2937441 RepID=A0ABT1BPZ8_9BURK|nr:outer membrane beta-barrel protein [Ideonella oryzae]MCO5978302.1 outer membrane beta-barrel protein [Ideonella oryzae]